MIALQDTKLVYKHFATLYFVFVIDNAESELGILDLIQGNYAFSSRIACPSFSGFIYWTSFGDPAVFVETLDRCFKNVCELDIVYNFGKVRNNRNWKS